MIRDQGELKRMLSTNPYHLKKHISITASPDIQTIMEAALGKYGISFFRYMRYYYSDNSMAYLINNAAWGLHYLQHYSKRVPAMMQANRAQWRKYLLFSSNDHIDIVVDASQNFNFDYGLSIFQHTDQHIDIYSFSTHRYNRSMHNFYFNHLELFENFVLLFNEKASALLNAVHKNRLVIPGTMASCKNSPPKLKRYYFSDNGQQNYLTQRELDLVRSFINISQQQQLADSLGISKRTAEIHLTHIKEKLKCTSLFQLAYKLTKLQLL